MDKKLFEEFVKLEILIKGTNDPDEIKKYWREYFDLALGELGYSEKIKKLLWKKFAKILYIEITDCGTCDAKGLKSLFEEAIELTRKDKLHESKIFGAHLIFSHLINEYKKEKSLEEQP